VLPAAGVGDHQPPPDAGRAVEVEETAGAIAAAVLEHEVTVEQNRLDPRQQRILAVDVPPARLHHPHFGIGKLRQGALQEVGGSDEVGVEDGDELAARDMEPRFEGPGLVADPVDAVQILDVEALGGEAAHGQLGDLPRLVGRIVEHLNLEPVLRVVQRADRLDQPVDDVHLVEDGELNRNDGQRVGQGQRLRNVVPVLHVQINKVVPMPAVDSQDDQDEKIGGENQRLGCSHRGMPVTRDMK
jgi:hypothetical protein